MSTRIEGGLSARLNSNAAHASAPRPTVEIPLVAHQVVAALFGRKKPAVLDPDDFPELSAIIKMLNRFRRKLAVMAEDREDDYVVVLAEGELAMIDEFGTIYFGAGFIRRCKDDPDILIGALAHEIGHQPKRWIEYDARENLTVNALHELCRHEETRADIFAGKGLAELAIPCEPLCQYLMKFGTKSHPRYHPSDVRANIIRDAHASRSKRIDARRKLFPEYHQAISPRTNLGEF